MKKTILLLVFILLLFGVSKRENPIKTIHVFVALCDNANQGIVPVPAKLGNGQDPKSNLYWGALYGIKTHFKNSEDWSLVKTMKSDNPKILERLLFKHKSSNTFMLADAYDGKYIKQTTIDFLEATAGRNEVSIAYNSSKLSFGGNSKLLAYVGHDGLMEFNVDGDFSAINDTKRDAIILACVSKTYFKPYFEQTKASPLVWTTGLMAPEAYTLKSAIEGWVADETDVQIRERAAQAYHKYQKCGIKAARRLLVTGY
ncbi:hypothetical protein [Winogradskyella flava]|uniref:Uncharacterized protein n=1 Tax=Winogradskyella flava TaxID=1884876 RepID=A0A842INP1_9FLAO|nr:hypothetical protein [Winogradskyella flava]MBC2844275.1 hypothetical protein [Winogradskyella flava]